MVLERGAQRRKEQSRPIHDEGEKGETAPSRPRKKTSDKIPRRVEKGGGNGEKKGGWIVEAEEGRHGKQEGPVERKAEAWKWGRGEVEEMNGGDDEENDETKAGNVVDMTETRKRLGRTRDS